MKPPNPISLAFFVITLTLIVGVGYLALGEFPQKRESTVSIWYVEEIEDPYGSGATVIQVTYKDPIFQDKVILFYKTDLSSSLNQSRYRLVFEINDRLWTKTKPWLLVEAYPVS